MIWEENHLRKHPNGVAIKFILFTKSVHMLMESMSMYRISITSIYYVYININHSEVCKKNTSPMDGMEMHGNAWLFAGKSSFPSIQSSVVPKLDLEKTFSVGPKTTCKWGNTLPETNSNFAPENKPKPKRKRESIPTIHFQGRKC